MKTNRFFAVDVATVAARLTRRFGHESIALFWVAQMIPTARFK